MKEKFMLGLGLGFMISIILFSIVATANRNYWEQGAIKNGYGHIDNNRDFQWNKKEK